jgi:hypothetical protein
VQAAPHWGCCLDGFVERGLAPLLEFYWTRLNVRGSARKRAAGRVAVVGPGLPLRCFARADCSCGCENANMGSQKISAAWAPTVAYWNDVLSPPVHWLYAA